MILASHLRDLNIKIRRHILLISPPSQLRISALIDIQLVSPITPTARPRIDGSRFAVIPRRARGAGVDDLHGDGVARGRAEGRTGDVAHVVHFVACGGCVGALGFGTAGAEVGADGDAGVVRVAERGGGRG